MRIRLVRRQKSRTQLCGLIVSALLLYSVLDALCSMDKLFGPIYSLDWNTGLDYRTRPKLVPRK